MLARATPASTSRSPALPCTREPGRRRRPPATPGPSTPPAAPGCSPSSPAAPAPRAPLYARLADGHRRRRGARRTAPPRPAAPAPAGAAAGLRPRPAPRPGGRRRTGPVLPEPHGRSRPTAIRCRRCDGSVAEHADRARRAAGDAQHADQRDRPLRAPAAGVRAARRRGRPARPPRRRHERRASTCCSTATTTPTCPVARWAVRRRSTWSAATRGAVPVPAAMPDVRQRVGLDRSPIDVARPRAAALAGGVRVAGPDRPLRAAARRARARRRRAASTIRPGDAVADTAALAAGAGRAIP